MQRVVRFGLQGQHIAHHAIEFLREHATQTNALHLVIEFGIKWVDVDGQTAFTPQVIPNIFKAGRDEICAKTQLATQSDRKLLCIFGRVFFGIAFICKQRWVFPDRFAIFSPKNGQSPTRQLLAWIPLTLSKMQEPAISVFGS